MKAIAAFLLPLFLVTTTSFGATIKMTVSRSAQCAAKGNVWDMEKKTCRAKSFVEWCNSPENDEDTELTVSRILNALNVSDCDDAIATLKQKPILNLATPGLKINDVRPIGSLTMLKELYLINHRISDITPLRRLTHLTKLSVRQNRIADVAPLADLKDLEILDISGNFVTQYAILAQNHKLKKIRVDRADAKFADKNSAQVVIATP